MIQVTKRVFLVVLMGLSLIACKTKKKVVEVTSAPKPVVEASAKKSDQLALFKAKDIPFNTLAIKAKAYLDFGGNKNGVTMNVRMERDKRIWVSITAIAGIEVARALITPDSIKVRNNFQSTHIEKPFSYAYRYTNKNVSFKMLQAILAGNTVPDFFTELSDVNQQGESWIVKGEDGTLAFSVLLGSLLKVTENNLSDAKSGQALKVSYAGYQQLNDGLFPTRMTINSMAGTKKVSLDLEYQKVDRNIPLEFPYSVPRKFELVN
jgi:hypothetical protein